jgi:hypothetical protein
MGKKNKKHKFNYLSPPSTYTYDDFKSINGGVSRRYFYNNGKRSDVFGRTSEKEKWSNPYNAWTKYNTSGLMPQGFQPSSYQTIRNYNSISYNSLKDAENLDINKGKTNRKKIVPNNTVDSSELLHNNIKVAESEYNNYLRNRIFAENMKKDIEKKNGFIPSENSRTPSIRSDQTILTADYSPSFFYSSPVKYTRDYFGSTLYKNTKNSNPNIADLEKLVSSQYWIPKSKLPHAQGSGMKVYQKSIPNNIPIKEWYKYYPNLPLNYYNNSFL